MISSNFGSPYYYYFYNWDVSIEKESCYSEIVEVNGVYNPDTNTEDLRSLQELTIYPNPSSDMLFIKDFDLSFADEINIYDLNGRKQQINLKQGYIDSSKLLSGHYILELKQESTIIRANFIKQ